MSSTEKERSARFAEDIARIDAARLSGAELAQLKLLVLDYCAVAICGSVQPWGLKIRRWAERYAGQGRAVAIGSGARMAAPAAALVNGLCGHGYELDDTHEASRSHPGAVVNAAALALGTELGSSGRDFLTAIAAGYEAMTRIGMAAYGTCQPAQGWHKTSIFGGFGAAAVAARLMRLDAEGLNRAWGVALSMAGGSTQFSLEPHGDMVKRLVAGLPAQNGILAAQIASTGLTAPARSLEGEHGFLAMFGRDPDPSLLVVPEGAPLQIMETSFKPYSCCRHFHAVIDALEAASDGFSLPLESISDIAVHVPPAVMNAKHLVKRPDTVMAAQYSLYYAAAATLVHGPYKYRAYGETHLQEAAILSVIDKVDVHGDAALAARARDRMPARVVLTLKDGTRREATVLAALGSPENPVDRGRIMRKARALTGIAGPALDPEALDDAVDALPEAADLSDLADALHTGNAAS